MTGMVRGGAEAARRVGGTAALGRVALFLPSLGGGGAERVLVYLAKLLAGRGLQVDLVAVQATGPYLDEATPPVRVVDLRANRVASSLPGLVRYLRSERPAALLSTLEHTNAVALVARRVAGVNTRVVIRIANMVTPGFARARGFKARRVLPAVVRLTYRSADHVVAVSSEVAKDVAAYAGLRRDRVSVIYNPLPVADLKRKASARLDHPWFAPGEPPVILGVGRLTPQKDYPTLIRAFADVLGSRQARLLILGEGDERRRLESMIRELGIAEHVALPGFVRNPYPYMAHASVFVLSSAWEGFPNALVEAMALGTPVVSTNCPGGPGEILDGGRFGILVPVGDHEAMARGILGQLVHGEAYAQVALNRIRDFDDRAVANAYARTLLQESS